MTHEKNMIDYLDWIEGVFLDNQTARNNIFAHRDFLKSPPKLGDYVATNEKGEVMEKPEPPKSDSELIILNWHKEMLNYNEALDRVLWKGWEVEDSETRKMGKFKILCNDGETIAICKDKEWVFWKDKYHTADTYNDLITSGVKLERIQGK